MGSEIWSSVIEHLVYKYPHDAKTVLNYVKQLWMGMYELLLV